MRRPTTRRGVLTGFRASRAGKAGLVALVILALAAFGAPALTPDNPLAQSFASLQPPSWSHWFGTDELGRDIFSRALYGLRSSLLVALATATLAGIVGIAIGLFSGFIGGLVDATVMRVIDVILAFPAILLALVMVAIMGGGLIPLILALTIVGVPPFARLTRASTVSIREREYVIAQRSAGATPPDIMVRTVLPNAIGSAAVQFVVAASTAVLTEAGLSFLGLGLPPPTPALGSMLFAGNDNLFISPWYSITVGLTITVLIASLDAFGHGLQRQFGAPARRTQAVA